MGRTTKVLVLVAALAGLAGATGCAGDDEDDSLSADDAASRQEQPEEPAGDDPGDGSDGESDGGEDEDGTSAADDGEVTPPPTRRQAEAEVSQVPMQVDVGTIRRIGERLELEVTITNRAAAATDTDPMAYRPGFELGGGDVSNIRMVSQTDTEGFYPLKDGQGRCLCSEDLGMVELGPGQSATYFATYAGVPSSITSVDVYVPGFPALTGIPIDA